MKFLLLFLPVQEQRKKSKEESFYLHMHHSAEKDKKPSDHNLALIEKPTNFFYKRGGYYTISIKLPKMGKGFYIKIGYFGKDLFLEKKKETNGLAAIVKYCMPIYAAKKKGSRGLRRSSQKKRRKKKEQKDGFDRDH